MLAVTLNHLESSRILLRHGADVIVENKQGYTGMKILSVNKSPYYSATRQTAF